MQLSKKLKTSIYVLILIMSVSTNLKSAEECFENTSRAIFKFNMALDDIILEPLAMATTNSQILSKSEQATLHRILEPCYLFQIIFYKEILSNLVIQLVVLR